MLKLVQKQDPQQPSMVLVTKARVLTSIRDIEAAAWNACYPAEIENYDYLLTIEEADILGFAWRYIVVEEAGRIVAAMPLFFTDYALDTTLDNGPVRRIIRKIRTRFPTFLTLKLACLGSPETEQGRVGFHPSINDDRKPELLQQLLAAFEHTAQQNGAALLGIKDTSEDQLTLWNQVAQSYTSLPGMAVAILPIDFANIEEYLSRLSKNSRKDMRRKLKDTTALRIEYRHTINDVLPQIMSLYAQTKARSEFHLDDLTPQYFTGLLSRMATQALCTLYWVDDALIGANFMLRDDTTLLDKFLCMADQGREHNLYFISWFENLQYCLDHGLKYYQSGQACLENKKRLKSQLKPSLMWFRHRSRLINRILKTMAPLLAMGEDA